MRKKRSTLKWNVSLFLIMLVSISQAEQKDLNVLVVRGGHSYDTPEFENMCMSLEGIKANLVLTAHFESMKASEISEKYDAILFLNQNKHYTEYEWNKQKYIDLTELGVGMVFLHFTLSSQPEWNTYHDIIGGKWFLKRYTKDEKLLSTYFIDIPVDINILDKKHPVTKGLEDFTLTDTFYGNIYMSENVKPLLGTKHKDVWHTIAWAHEYNQSKVVYIMPGFSKKAYGNPSYKKLIANALNYVGTKMK